ncbi:RsmB/NOP family class I SAM-dependent RNA methyltransferase [Candidatus Woesearchaeota archaeon]|nr:RsmB/NOP family class I SAM-dependent RNA methyltransferase [Candidatus Woesearchaeota archaeon]
MEFKKEFVERYSALTDWEEFKRYSLSYLRRSIRVNTLLTTVEDVKKSLAAKGWILEQIPWCPEGFWISNPERKDVGNLLEHQVGYIYVQEAASMVPPVVLAPQEGDMVLDMCASPGSKTTQLAAMMKNTGVLVANDYKGLRLQSLGINVQRCGMTNCIITLMHGKRFHGFLFDKILVDAPCSGTGTIRKSLKTVTIWNASMITKLARQQKELITTAFANLKPGGEMVYSTCSVEPEEDEGVIDYLLKSEPTAQVVPVKLQGLVLGKPVMSFKGVDYHPDVKHSLRLWPQDNDTEGFFVCKIRKTA